MLIMSLLLFLFNSSCKLIEFVKVVAMSHDIQSSALSILPNNSEQSLRSDRELLVKVDTCKTHKLRYRGCWSSHHLQTNQILMLPLIFSSQKTEIKYNQGRGGRGTRGRYEARITLWINKHSLSSGIAPVRQYKPKWILLLQSV